MPWLFTKVYKVQKTLSKKFYGRKWVKHINYNSLIQNKSMNVLYTRITDACKFTLGHSIPHERHVRLSKNWQKRFKYGPINLIYATLRDLAIYITKQFSSLS